MTDALLDRPRTLRIVNGDPVQPMFSDAEMERRLAGVRATMSDLALDAVVFTSHHNVNYYADFLYCAFGRPYALVVTGDGQTSVSANIDRRRGPRSGP